MKQLLLTGANGFVGSYLKSKYTDKYNIETFSFLNDNFDDLDLNSVDTVVHLSALVHQMGGANKEEYERVNVVQTLDLAKKAKASGVKQFVFMSSVKVYGEETNVTYSETTTCKPEDEYGKSKLKAENELRKLESDNFQVSIIRTPIVYGYGVKANIKNLISLVQKVPVLPFGNIQNRRSMVYIGNLCHMIDEIIQQRAEGVFLASDDVPISTTRLTELIAQSLKKQVYLVKIPFFELFLKLLKPSFHKRLYERLEVDNSLTKKRLNLINPVSTEDGIRLMMKKT
ncbi:MAG: NAD-dependent epimerase/dehydratase family protein [Sulfurospirillum sp.]